MKRLFVFSALCLFSSVAAFGQTGFPPYGSFEDGRFDAVNRQNLNVNFAIPIVSVPGRGFPLSHTLVYDSLIWNKAGSVWLPAPTG